MIRRVPKALAGLLALGVAALRSTTRTSTRRSPRRRRRPTRRSSRSRRRSRSCRRSRRRPTAKVDEQGKEIEQLSQSAKDALKRAQEAGVLAKGKVVFEQTFTEDRVHFKTSSYDLTKEAKAALDEFASKVKELDEPVWLEIQGHTDDTGGAAINDALGQQRAEAVRRYLAREHKLPLARMSTISYGDTLPIAPNKTAKGRAENRRVVIVVLE